MSVLKKLQNWQKKVVDSEPQMVVSTPVSSGKFQNLHHHDEFSIRGALGTAEQGAARCKELGQEFLSITNYMELSGWVRHYFKCKDAGIKPVLGLEAFISNYHVHTKQLNKTKTVVSDVSYHGAFGAEWTKPVAELSIDEKSEIGLMWNVLLYASSLEGYYNIIRIHNDAQINGLYDFPRATEKFMSEHGKGIICVIPNPNGEIVNFIDNGDFDLAKKKYDEYAKIFDEVYIELSLEEDEYYVDVNNAIVTFCRQHGIQMVVGINSHYLVSSDEDVYEQLLRLRRFKGGAKQVINKVPNMSMKSHDEVVELFKSRFCNDVFTQEVFETCIFNINKICSKCGSVELDTSIKAPKFENGVLIIKEKSYEGLKRIGKSDDKQYIARLEYELDNLIRAGFVDYFMFLEDLCTWARNNGVLRGTGRGCFIPTSRVRMADGFYKFICDIVVGDIVVSGDGYLRKVLDKFCYDVDEDLVEITLEDGRLIYCTEDHEILVSRNEVRVWVEAGDLVDGDSIVEIKDLKIVE